MAIDTRAKRASVSTFGIPGGFPALDAPDGSVSQADRADLLGLYAGLSYASGPTSPSGTSAGSSSDSAAVSTGAAVSGTSAGSSSDSASTGLTSAYTGALRLDFTTEILVIQSSLEEASLSLVQGAPSDGGEWRSGRTPQRGRNRALRWGPLRTPWYAVADGILIESLLASAERRTAEGWAVNDGPVEVYVVEGPHRTWEDSLNRFALEFTLEEADP